MHVNKRVLINFFRSGPTAIIPTTYVKIAVSSCIGCLRLFPCLDFFNSPFHLSQQDIKELLTSGPQCCCQATDQVLKKISLASDQSRNPDCCYHANRGPAPVHVKEPHAAIMLPWDCEDHQTRVRCLILAAGSRRKMGRAFEVVAAKLGHLL